MLNTSAVSAQADGAIPGLSIITDAVVRDAAIAFVNLSTTPGLEGATLSVDSENRQSLQRRASLGFSAEFTLQNNIFNGYWGLAIVNGSLIDNMDLQGDVGQPVQLDLTRNVLGLSGSFGLSFPISQHLKLRPTISLVISDLQTKFTTNGLIGIDPAGNTTTTTTRETQASMASTVGAIDAIYSHWYANYKLELSAVYNVIYTDSFSESNPLLDTYDLNQSAHFTGKISGATNLRLAGRPWRWNAYTESVHFISYSKAALGYKNLFEIGGGLDWHINIKPLDWFGWQSLGLRLGLIVGEDVEGFNLGLTAQ